MNLTEGQDLELNALEQFYGAQTYYKVLGALVTDGVKYIMDNGYSWFVTDAIVVMKGSPKLKRQPFLTVKLEVKDCKADLIIEDGDYNRLYKQHYDSTDAKRDLKLFYTDNVLMLAEEY